MSGDNAMGNPICSICYEDLKPVVEHLQSISVCGHVFHELCLQQWFEYCSSSNKRTCPVCKQKCLMKDACRLFFQSSGCQSDSVTTQKVADVDEDPKVLRGDIKRLEGKIAGLSFALEGQKKEIVEVTNELRLCKEQLKEEKEKRWEALQAKVTTQQLLTLKSEECDRLTSQCSMLKEKTMALAKELAALKLVSDISLGEDDILKLALLGNEAKTKDTIDTLVKSLVVRNRSYKELLAKCNQLGRGEARSSEKLEKAMEKIDKLKKRVRELEVSTEEKENGALRALKISKKHNECSFPKPENKTFPSIDTLPSDNLAEQPVGKLERSVGFSDEQPSTRGREDFFSSRMESVVVVDDDVADFRHSNAAMNHQKSEHDVEEKCSTIDDPVDRNVKFNIRKDPPSSGLLCKSAAGDMWFSSGLLGHDGNKRGLGKWCKRTQSQVQTPSLGSMSGNGELIAVGPDGRGGRVKVLRSHAQISSDPIPNSGYAKRFKQTTRASGSQSQGCLQIEHFFRKSDH